MIFVLSVVEIHLKLFAGVILIRIHILLALLCCSCITEKRILEAENKAIDYLGASEIKFDYQFLYNHLKSKFGWRTLSNDAEFRLYCNINDSSASNRSQKEVTLIRNYKKLINPDYVLEERHIQEAFGLDKIGLTALYCNNYQIDQTRFFKDIDSLSVMNDYEVTHALLAIYFLEQNQCFSGEKLNSLKKRSHSKNLELIEARSEMLDDIAIEAIALLQSTNCKIKPSWIKEILKNQNVDGGWAVNGIESTSNTHTTMLALWALSSYRNK